MTQILHPRSLKVCNTASFYPSFLSKKNKKTRMTKIPILLHPISNIFHWHIYSHLSFGTDHTGNSWCHWNRTWHNNSLPCIVHLLWNICMVDFFVLQLFYIFLLWKNCLKLNKVSWLRLNWLKILAGNHVLILILDCLSHKDVVFHWSRSQEQKCWKLLGSRSEVSLTFFLQYFW